MSGNAITITFIGIRISRIVLVIEVIIEWEIIIIVTDNICIIIDYIHEGNVTIGGSINVAAIGISLVI